MSLIVAIPVFGDEVAPCFEAARNFLIARIADGAVRSTRMVECRGCEGFGRVQLLRESRANVLVCNGIKHFYRDLLQAAGLLVVSHVSASAVGALEDFLSGRLTADADTAEPVDLQDEIPLADLICWTEELFTAHGYAVRKAIEVAPFPIDLVAEIECPVCGKPVRVAICCGAHMYRPEQEIQLFHLHAAHGYHARVYVHPASEQIMRQCRDYAIELIDPDSREFSRDHPVADRIPLLRTAVGHEGAFPGKIRNDRTEQE